MKVKELIETLQSIYLGSIKEDILELEVMIDNQDMGWMNRIDSIGYHKNYNVYIGQSLNPIKQDVVTIIVK